MCTTTGRLVSILIRKYFIQNLHKDKEKCIFLNLLSDLLMMFFHSITFISISALISYIRGNQKIFFSSILAHMEELTLESITNVMVVTFQLITSHFSRVTYPQLLSWRLHISVNPLQSCNLTLYGLHEQKGTTYTNNAPTKLRGRTTWHDRII